VKTSLVTGSMCSWGPPSGTRVKRTVTRSWRGGGVGWGGAGGVGVSGVKPPRGESKVEDCWMLCAG
jgi:hypothetical protein